MKTIEQKAANTILEKPQEVRIGKETFQVAPPTVATLIEVSELVSTMPEIRPGTEDVFSEALRIAKDSAVLGDILAILILGADKTKGNEPSWLKLFFLRIKGKKKITHKKLADKILWTLTPHEINDLMCLLLGFLEIGDFFAVTSSLANVNILQPTVTREEVTTVSGQ
jgi:hypothetical protein